MDSIVSAIESADLGLNPYIDSWIQVVSATLNDSPKNT